MEKEPNWWHAIGYQMRVQTVRQSDRTLIIAGFWTQVNIKLKTPDHWTVEWSTDRGIDNWSKGSVPMTDQMVKQAFGPEEEELQEPPGIFVRAGNFLNLPCRGTGQDPDPNVSIYVSSEIQVAAATVTYGLWTPRMIYPQTGRVIAK